MADGAPPFELYRQHVTTVLAWQDLRGQKSIWSLIRDQVATLDGPTLVGCATHWNALLQNAMGQPDLEAQVPIVEMLARSAPDLLQEIDGAIARKAKRERQTFVLPPPIVNRQALLILMRLAFQHARWNGDGAPISGRRALELILRINDHLDGLPDLPPRERRRRRPGRIARAQAFPLMFSLHDFSHRPGVEEGITRTLRMMREIHPQLALTDPGSAVDVLGLFRSATGLTLEDYLTLCFAASALTTGPGRPGSPHPGPFQPEDTGIFNLQSSNLRGDSAITDDLGRQFLDGLWGDRKN